VIGTLDVFSNTHHGFNAANGFSIDADGNIYVSQLDPNQVAKFSPSGDLLTVFGTTGPGAFNEQPGPVFVDATGRVFITQGPERGSAPGVLVYAPDGTYLGGFGPVGSSDESLAFPTGIVVRDGMAYVEDFGDEIPGKATGSLKAFRLLPPLAP